MKIIVQKYTDINALHTANSFTTGHESKMSLRTAYRLMHTPIRTQRFYVFLEEIPLFVASQLVRTTQGVSWYQRSKRTDRGGEDFVAECHDFGQRLDLIAENINEGLSEKKADELTQTLGEMENEVKDWPLHFDRYAPTSLMGDMNAEAIINVSKRRLCSTASKETREIWQRVIAEIAKVDPDLAKFCVKPCVFSGGICREHKGCGFNKTELFQKKLTEYKKNFL